MVTVVLKFLKEPYHFGLTVVLNSKSLAANGKVQNSKLLLKDCWDSTSWDVAKIIELVGEEKMGKIMSSTVQCKPGQDRYIWKPYLIRNITTHSAWELVRSEDCEVSPHRKN